MSFEKTHASFLSYHLEHRSGERKGRLERGHQHAEILFLKNVWFPYKGHFKNLHPEYEVLDWRGRSYFGDFAYFMELLKFIFEIKGYSTHVQNMDRTKYSEELNRETFMQSLGFRVVSFAYDDVAHRPELCITLLRMLLGQFSAGPSPADRALLAEKEIIRLAIQCARPIRPVDVVNHFNMNQRTAVRLLQNLCTKGWLRPSLRGDGLRHVQYELEQKVWDHFDW
jgi:hypothetical protein